MNKRRTCATCGNDFEQTFGGRPRKNCYDCAPARLHQNAAKAGSRRQAGGQNDDTPVKHGNRKQPSGQSPSATAQEGVHCGYCGAFTPEGEDYCNKAHAEAHLDQLAWSRPAHQAPARMRPLERVRRMRDEQLDAHHSDTKQRARERARTAA